MIVLVVGLVEVWRRHVERS